MNQSIDLYSGQNKYIDNILKQLVPSDYKIQVQKYINIFGDGYKVAITKNDFNNKAIKVSIKKFDHSNAREIVSILVGAYDKMYRTQE